MSWKPIIVGVDASPAAADAVAFGVEAARRAATVCYLVHAAPDVPARGREPYPYTRLDQRARAALLAALANRLPAPQLTTLTVRRGPPAAVLGDAVTARGAELVVLGGKQHSTLGRWLGGSTSVSVARSTLVPLLVTVGQPAIRRILVTVDQSSAARPTLAAAERYAALFGAELRALSVIEPLPALLDMPRPDAPDYPKLLEETVARDIWSLIRAPGVDTLVRHGTALETILHEAAEWRADLLVVGSHGKGPVKRLIVGSVTERLINNLPTSLLVVPAGVATIGHEAGEVMTANEEGR